MKNVAVVHATMTVENGLKLWLNRERLLKLIVENRLHLWWNRQRLLKAKIEVEQLWMHLLQSG